VVGFGFAVLANMLCNCRMGLIVGAKKISPPLIYFGANREY
jgi:hypothetical protein